MDGGAGGYDSADASHRALRGIQRELERHPAVAYVEGFPSGPFTLMDSLVKGGACP